MRRVIFALLYDRGQFALSRNFRLQQVGDIDWLFSNYDFGKVSRGLDELMLIDVSRGERNTGAFAATVERIASQCFIPLTVGGGILDLSIAVRYLRSGADKLLLNSAFETHPEAVSLFASRFGRQCIVAGIDFRTDGHGGRTVFTQHGSRAVARPLEEWVQAVQDIGAGEILFQSIDRDGTGMGLDLGVVSEMMEAPEVPCILMGGVGRARHIVEGLECKAIDAVATANLFNFVGSAFLDVRNALVRDGIEVAQWAADDYAHLKGALAAK